MKRMLVALTPLFALFVLTALVQSAPEARGEALDGKAVFLGEKCNTCHSVPAADIEAKVKSEKMKGPDLPACHTDGDWMAAFLRQEEVEGHPKHKKAFKGSDEELGAMIEWIRSQKQDASK